MLDDVMVSLRQFPCNIGYSEIAKLSGCMIVRSSVNQPWYWCSLFVSIKFA